MKTLTVDLGERSYPVVIGKGLLEDAALLAKHLHGQDVMIVSNTRVAPLYLDRVKAACKDRRCDTVVLPDGEQHKTLTVLDTIFDTLLENHHHRDTTLIGLGGGVITDMTGFAAACYQRGVHFIQLPTSLLAQVDASVGGKTGVNHPLGKNMIGAFYQPQAVIIDTETLTTLPDRELSAGLAEVIKAALIQDTDFLDWLEAHMPKLLNRDSEALATAIERACKIKATIVAADEREAGQRAWLNFGHTFGHAIETCLHYEGCLHGEAVAIGMVLAAELSAEKGWITADEVARIRQILLAARLPIQLPSGVQYAPLLQAMTLDKKVLDDQVRFILLSSLGKAVICSDVTQDQCQAILQRNAG